jgi:hypothetical protein
MTNEKIYLENLVGRNGFDINNLGEKWQEDDNGWYTTDEQEAAWYGDLGMAYDVFEGLGMQAPEFDDYDSLISYVKDNLYFTGAWEGPDTIKDAQINARAKFGDVEMKVKLLGTYNGRDYEEINLFDGDDVYSVEPKR